MASSCQTKETKHYICVQESCTWANKPSREVPYGSQADMFHLNEFYAFLMLAPQKLKKTQPFGSWLVTPQLRQIWHILKHETRVYKSILDIYTLNYEAAE